MRDVPHFIDDGFGKDIDVLQRFGGAFYDTPTVKKTQLYIASRLRWDSFLKYVDWMKKNNHMESGEVVDSKRNLKKIILGVTISAVLTGITVIALGNNETTATINPVNKVIKIEYDLSAPTNFILLKQGESKTIPLNLVSPPHLSLHLKTGVTVIGNEGTFVSQGISNLPKGIVANLDKQVFDLQAEASSLQTPVIRNTTNLTISASQDASVGKHQLAVMLIDGHEQSSTTYITVDVEK